MQNVAGPGGAVIVRSATAPDLEPLARLWYDAWHEAHAGIVPKELVKFRTVDSFRRRLDRALPHVRVAGPEGHPDGFCLCRGMELDQLFVSARARGSGVAAALMDDAEHCLRASGAETAFLACAIGNNRAARFYEKRGWQRVGTMINHAETEAGPFLLEVWRYEKRLTSPTWAGAQRS
jgi:GNAT superfamily N-acetyltransferase